MNDAKLQAFVSRKCPEIFHSIEHANDIWLPDPFDVASIHQPARETFGRLVEQALSGRVSSGRILVIRGEAGSGKTHLMRAFRNMVHADGNAFFAYMQMTTTSLNYERYVLHNLIDSLQQPYHPDERRTSLQVLSNRLTELLPGRRVADLRDAESGPEAAPIVFELADRLVDRNDLPPVDLDFVRAILFLQVGRPSITTKVNKYLRAEELSDYDRQTLGGIAPLHAEDAPLKQAMNLARLIRTPLERALVVCVDQLEDVFNLDAAKERFPRAMSAVTSLAELPSVVVVVSCLEQFYVQLRESLSTSTVHRLEQDPPPLTLAGMRTRDEAKAMIARRLHRLWEEAGISSDGESIEPFPERLLETVEGQHSRAILAACLHFRTAAIERGAIPPFEAAKVVAPEASVEIPVETSLGQAWNDLRTASQPVPEDETERRDLLASVLPLIADELGAPSPLVAEARGQAALSLRAPWFSPTHVAVTEAAAQGGRLLRQMEAAQAAAKEASLVLLRTDAFAKTPTAKTAKTLGKIVASGGRGVQVSDADWRHLVAFQRFHHAHRQAPGYASFRRNQRPLLGLKVLEEILDLEHLELIARAPGSPSEEPSQADDEHGAAASGAGAKPPTVPAEPADPASPPLRADDPVELGVTQSRRPAPVTLDVDQFRRHAAFLGGTGSGKTTAAMTVIEQLLARRIPAILVDRKGDLCGYGMQQVWTEPLSDPRRAALRDRLAATVDVQIYTPGAPAGRNLGVPLMPADVATLPEDERETAARIAAEGLAGMMSYRTSQAHQGGRVAIARAIVYLASFGETPTIQSIIDLLREPEDEFVASLNTLAKFCDRTVTDLEILKAQKSGLLGSDGEVLDVSSMLEPRQGGRVPLTILSTKFLGSESDVQFWVAQLLVNVSRWLDQNPRGHLQGVVMLDEADLYLPAIGKPVSKKPVEDLLRRARSKGLGVFLATQSPGDLDYRCRDNIVSWLVGLIAQKTALDKLQPMFNDAHVEPSRLAGQGVGEFHFLHEGHVQAIKVHMNAVPLPSQVADEEILALARMRGRNKG